MRHQQCVYAVSNLRILQQHVSNMQLCVAPCFLVDAE
jgi:hypothetical protein